MKASVIAIILCLATAGCQRAPTRVEKIIVTTPVGRKEVANRQYTLKEVEKGSIAAKPAKNPFDVQHPVYPQKQELKELKRHFKAGNQLWYFHGLDSGWAVVRNGQVVWVLVTNHEY